MRADDRAQAGFHDEDVLFWEKPRGCEHAQATIEQGPQRCMSQLSAQHHHCGVQLSPELGSRPASALSDQPSRHLRACAGSQRGSGVKTAVMAAGGLRAGRCLELLKLRPDRHEL